MPTVVSSRSPARSKPRMDVRSALLEGALAQIALFGAASLEEKKLCRQLGVSPGELTEHFGGREGLISEAMAMGYDRYVEELWEAAQAAGPNPLDRLMAWIERQVSWTSENAGLAAALNFPDYAAGNPLDMPSALRTSMGEAAARNFHNLRHLVAEVRASLHGASQSVGEMVDNLDSAVIGWVTLGLSVWLSGRHLPSRDSGAHGLLPLSREHIRLLVVSFLSRD